jgi:8-oxo-dGTP pyrophosphatase MutT (NUDIX family)
MNLKKKKNKLELKFSNNIDEFIDLLQKQLGERLPGITSQLKLAPLHRRSELIEDPPIGAIKSSVLLLLYPFENKIFTTVILRSEYEGLHSAQISLPGGRMEETDMDLSVTALREAHEEIGLDISKVKLLGSLSMLYISRSNYIVFPYIGFMPEKPHFIPDPIEVQEIIEFEISELIEPDAIIHKTLYFGNGFSIVAPGYQTGDHFMWGATAMIFSEFLDIVRSILN